MYIPTSTIPGIPYPNCAYRLSYVCKLSPTSTLLRSIRLMTISHPKVKSTRKVKINTPTGVTISI
jgi:hypothetical protein